MTRTEDGKPNLNGIWQSFTTANWDIEAHEAQPGPHPAIMGAWGAQPGGLGIVEGGEIPYKPEALEKKRENFKNRMAVKVTNDPHRFDSGETELQCYRPGVPRANYMPYPFQIFQNEEQILIVYEYKGASRTVYMDPHLDAPADSWMGWSNGSWDGDTLVVDVTAFNGYPWFDRAGNFRQRQPARRRTLDAQGSRITSCTKPPSRTRRCLRVPGRSASRSIAAWSRTSSWSSSTACRSWKR